MGYMTDHNLTIEGPTDKRREFEEFLKNNQNKVIRESNDSYPYHSVLAIVDDWDSAKWYHLEDDFIEISKNWKDLKFSVHCKGEEGEEYIQHFWAGNHKTQDSHLTWDEFDFSEIAPLKEKLDTVLKE